MGEEDCPHETDIFEAHIRSWARDDVLPVGIPHPEALRRFVARYDELRAENKRLLAENARLQIEKDQWHDSAVLAEGTTVALRRAADDDGVHGCDGCCHAEEAPDA